MKQRILTLASCFAMALASILSALFVIKPSIVRAYSSPGRPVGYVNDFGNVIPDAEQAEIEKDLSDFATTTSNEIVVVTIQSLGGDSKENFANELAREWGIGGARNGNGVLLLVALDERQIRIEVSQKLEGAITDLLSARIASNEIAPKFREGDYAGGIRSGVASLKLAAKGEYNESVSKKSGLSGIDPQFFLFAGFFAFSIIIWVGSFLARTKSWWAGGVIGCAIALVCWFFVGSTLLNILITIFIPSLGLFLDWLLSRNYKENIRRGGKGDFFGTWGGFSGGSSSGGGGFGGFGGGGSFGGGGGGSSW